MEWKIEWPWIVKREMRRVVCELTEGGTAVTSKPSVVREYVLKPVRYWEMRGKYKTRLDPLWVPKYGAETRFASFWDDLQAGTVSDAELEEIVGRRELWKSLRAHWEEESRWASWHESWRKRLDKTQVCMSVET